ncbi:MAG: hypothetical protein FH758_05640 [Firmicutes bacterium]|nr:hypothetical protein [Bacillota bacterium]
MRKNLLLVVITIVMTLLVASAATAAPPQWVMEKQLFKKAQKFENNAKFGHQYYKQLQKMAKWGWENGYPYQRFCYPVNRGELFPGELNQNWDVYVDTDELTIKFNDDIEPVGDLDDVLAGTTIIKMEDNESVAVEDVNINGNELTITTEDILEYDSRYIIKIDANMLKDEDGRNFGVIYWYFTTEKDNEEQLSVESLEPNNYEHNVDVDIDELIIKFNQGIQPVRDIKDVLEGITVTNLTDDENLEIKDIDIDDSELMIELEDKLEYDCRYKIELDEDILENEDGDNFEEFIWRFTTEED